MIPNRIRIGFSENFLEFCLPFVLENELKHCNNVEKKMTKIILKKKTEKKIITAKFSLSPYHTPSIIYSTVYDLQDKLLITKKSCIKIL